MLTIIKRKKAVETNQHMSQMLQFLKKKDFNHVESKIVFFNRWY